VHAPILAGVYGRVVQLADGRRVRADEAYIRDSILQPRRDVVVGFEPIMPSFEGLVDEGDLQRLVAYIQSLRGEAAR
jgi:cytochrome c oxidase subunit II